MASVARELGCAEILPRRWNLYALDASSDSEKELIALREKLHEMETERDILKKPPSSSGGTDSALPTQ